MLSFQRILITGGAGFVGSSLGLALRRDFSDIEVIAFDNLTRRGSELNLLRLTEAGIKFVHGDTRFFDDFQNVGAFDLLIDCAAEPSVQAGMHGSPKSVFDINLNGTINCLEVARKQDAAFLFLSTSRVYPIKALDGLPYRDSATRFEWIEQSEVSGVSPNGVAENFPLNGTRSYYGASKLASELVAQEYAENAGMPLLINRCGVLTGPWQMGKVDQGVAALWVLRHHFEQPLKYIGYGGTGHQVRDILHVNDLYELIKRQLMTLDYWNGQVFNVGGGREVSVSLSELTELCQQVTGKHVDIAPIPETNSVDLRIFLTDTTQVQKEFDWRPSQQPIDIVSDIHQWVVANESALSKI